MPVLRMMVTIESFLKILTLLLVTPINAQETGPKGFGVRPATPQFFEAVSETAPSGNAGLFVGVNRFSDPDVAPLQFAVHDAIEQAWLFVNELKLIAPKNCVLALSGEPKAEAINSHLSQLKRQGVRVVPANKVNLLLEVRRTCNAAPRENGDANLLVVSFSSHGFDEKGTAFLMPANGLRDFLNDTALKLLTVEEQMRKSHAGHRLLLVDACQERILGGGKTVNGQKAVAMSKAFQQAIQQPSGQAKLASCSVGQFSYEHASLGGVGHGVFTYALLEALRGGAAADDQNLVRLGAVSKFVTESVEAWVKEENRRLPVERRRPPQSPSYHGPENGRKLPLAVKSSDLKTLQQSLTRRIEPNGFTKELHDRLQQRLATYDPAKEADRDLLNSTRQFAEGKLADRFYVPYLKDSLKSSITRPAMLKAPFSEQQARTAREQWASYLQTEGVITNSIGMKLALIPPGEFQMGTPVSEADRDDNEHQHQVRISLPSFVGLYEVTQGEFEQVMRRNPSDFDEVEGQNTSRFPVEEVTWYDAVEFCIKLSEKEGLGPCYRMTNIKRDDEGNIESAKVENIVSINGYRLLTEAEWEYCCRAGTTTATHYGNSLSSSQANFDGDYPYNGGRKDKDLGRTTEVGSYQPNAFGLYDFHGNVREWCQDWYDEDYYKQSAVQDPWGPTREASYRVERGGCWGCDGRGCRSGNRYGVPPSGRNYDLGFRVLRVQPAR